MMPSSLDTYRVVLGGFVFMAWGLVIEFTILDLYICVCVCVCVCVRVCVCVSAIDF